jgi:hypothetical protein
MMKISQELVTKGEHGFDQNHTIARRLAMTKAKS